MDDDQTFEILESRSSIPRTSKSKDGFTRQDVVNSFHNAFKMIGGTTRLALWANANPDKFYPLYAKLMPSTSISFGDNTSLQIVHAIAPTALDNHPGGDHVRSAHETDDSEAVMVGRDALRDGD